MKMTKLTKTAAALGMAAILAGCGAMDTQGGRTAAGTGAGAALGAGLGVLIGDSSKSAAIGAGIGALVGGVAGYNWSGIKQDVQQSGATSLGVDVTEMPDGSLRVNIPSHVSFASGQSQLNPNLYPVLDSVARALVQNPELRAYAIGHTDSTGGAQLNQRLSVDRAQAVTSYLSQHGVNGSHLSAEGRGPNSPVANNDTTEGRAMNRRVELYLYAPQ